MTFRATLPQLLQILAATPLNLSDQLLVTAAVGLTTDTRTLEPGSVFLALQGENFDGHQFVSAAMAQGAIAAITSQPLPGDFPQLVVPDTLAAYQALGRWWRQQFAIPVIAITGSVGKTTTKELIAAVLTRLSGQPILKTQANYNNEIGVPKTLLELGPEHAYAVIEMGMRGPGEIACLTRIANPDLAVITNVGTAHIGRLGSREAIAQAKCELLAEMSATGYAILNADNPLLLATAERVWRGNGLTYGLTQGDLQGVLQGQILEVAGMHFPLPLPGEHNALNYLAALAVAQHLGLDWLPLTQGLTVNLPSGRAQRYVLPNDVVILDETYNAGPESMEAALKLLAQTPGQRRIAVLGPMRELGAYSLDLHTQLGRTVSQLNLDGLFILGTDAESTAIAAGAAPMCAPQFATQAALVAQLKEVVAAGDRLLFKASHSVGLSSVVEQLRMDLESRSPLKK